MSLDSTIEELVGGGLPLTLEALGGFDAIRREDAASSLFPYVAEALVTGWDNLDADQHATARDLIATAVSITSSGLALSETCAILVPEAVRLEIGLLLKTSLRDRVRSREDQRTAGLASVALRWLAHLAILSDTARGAVIDALSEVAVGQGESLPFASVSAQVAGVVYDHWRDGAATDCLVRLAQTTGDSDAWLALGQARLVQALEEADRESCLAGMRSTIECFDFAAANGGQRSDAVMYANAVRLITAWTAGATAAMLADYYENAHEALHLYMLHGLGLPDAPVWLRPRFEAETAWIELIKAMERVTDHGPADAPWYDAAIAIGALADVYRAANSFHPARSHAATTSHAVVDLVAPRLTGPFIEGAERLGYMARWLEEEGDSEAHEFAEFVRERAERVMPRKHMPPGGTPR